MCTRVDWFQSILGAQQLQYAAIEHSPDSLFLGIWDRRQGSTYARARVVESVTFCQLLAARAVVVGGESHL